MKVLFVEPGKKPYIEDIYGDLESLQKAVGGYIEFVYPFDDNVCLCCNEEGKLTGLELNRALRDEDGEIYDIIAGTFLVLGLGEEDNVDLTEEQMRKYEKVFETPEMFIKMGGKICALPLV